MQKRKKDRVVIRAVMAVVVAIADNKYKMIGQEKEII